MGILERLFEATRGSGRSYRGLAGADRYFLYLTAAGTGFRAAALASLTPADYDLTGAGPTVTLPARFNKSRRTKVQPVPADVAAALRGYLGGKAAGARVWGGTWARDKRGADMLRKDLEKADIPYSVEGPDGPLYADFHALRHSYLTLGGRSGIDLRTLQELAGHSKPELTARYSHRRLYDLTGAVGKLPTLVPPGGSDAGAAVRCSPTPSRHSTTYRHSARVLKSGRNIESSSPGSWHSAHSLPPIRCPRASPPSYTPAAGRGSVSSRHRGRPRLPYRGNGVSVGRPTPLHPRSHRPHGTLIGG